MLMNLSPILSYSVDEESDFGGVRCSAVDTKPHIHDDGQRFVDSLDISSWRYRILEELGDGTCGTVYKAIDCITNEIVAVKKMKRKFYFWEEYWRLREIKVLRRLNHPNVIKLKEVVKENDEVFLIFEYMNCNLYEIMRDCQRPFSEGEIRNFMSQVLHGLNHIHRSGYFHRDLKPENLLVTSDVLKIADFGLAREVSSMPPYTEYVSTRWYRAPEVLLQSKSYTPAVDMWAAGAILAELFTLTPIFPGESEIDQLFKICCVLGTPDLTFFPEGTNISRLYDIMPYEKIRPANLSDIVPNASPEAIDLMMKLFSWDPSKRPTADEALQHPFFNVAWIPHSLCDPLELKLSNRETEPNLELKLSGFGAEHEDCFLGLTLAVKPSAPSLDLFRDASQSRNKDSLFYSALEDQREQSVLWSLISPDRNSLCAPVESSSFSLSFSSIQHPSMRGSQPAGFSIPGLQPNILDGPFLGMSSPFPRRSLPLSDRLQ